MKILLLAILFQPIDTIPPLENLYACIEEYHQQILSAELEEYRESTKGEWLKYIPSVGVTYTINNQPRPSVSFSTNTIYQARKNKQLRAAKRKAIQKASLLNLQAQKSQLTLLIRQYESALESLTLSHQIHEIDTQLYEIEQAKYKRIKMAPSEYLKIQRAYLIKAFDLKEQEKEVAGILGEILSLVKC